MMNVLRRCASTVVLLLLAPSVSSFSSPPIAPRRTAAVGRSSSTRLVPLESVAQPMHPLTAALQAMHAAAACSLLAAPLGEGPMDAAVASLWETWESASWLTHLPLFEASVAVGAFVVWIAFFESVHHVLPDAHKWRLDHQPPVGALRGFGDQWHKTVVPAFAYLLSIHLFQVFELKCAPPPAHRLRRSLST
jgi:hypothetical protein